MPMVQHSIPWLPAGRFVPGVLLLACSTLSAQTLIRGSGPGDTVRIFNTDAAVLESQEVRKDLPCTVTPAKPALGFDLKFHAGYEVTVPLRELAGTENTLTMMFRLTPEHRKEEPVYLTQKYTVPTIEDGAKGDAYLQRHCLRNDYAREIYKNEYDMAVMCTDLLVTSELRKMKTIWVQEGMTDPVTSLATWTHRLGLPAWTAMNTAFNGSGNICGAANNSASHDAKCKTK